MALFVATLMAVPAGTAAQAIPVTATVPEDRPGDLGPRPDEPELPRTGADVMRLLEMAASLIAGGAVLVGASSALDRRSDA